MIESCEKDIVDLKIAMTAENRESMRSIACLLYTSMNIYAYIDKELKPETELYAAPFFNVTGSSVCLGSAKIDKPTEITYDKLFEYWEKKFWLTEFSHLGGNGNPTKSNLVLVTKAAKDAPFNIEELKPLKNLKLKDILR